MGLRWDIMADAIDFNEYRVTKLYPELMDILLYDFSSKKNIKWCTDNYRRSGIKFDDLMRKEALVYRKDSLIKPRILKSQSEQKKRSKDMAEVFTPSWMCNKQNNLIDNEWFGYDGAFNKEEGHTIISKGTKNIKYYVKDFENSLIEL